MLAIEKQFLFIHVRKTGGTSITDILAPYSEEKFLPTVNFDASSSDLLELQSGILLDRKDIHATLLDYKNVLEVNGNDIFESLFKFTVVRNPWDRVISYFFSDDWNKKDYSWDSSKILHSQAIKIEPLRNYVCVNSDDRLDSHIDFFLRFEHIEDDWKKLCYRVGVSYQPLSRKNASIFREDKKHYADYYSNDSEVIDFIGDLFEEEIKFFDYKYER